MQDNENTMVDTLKDIEYITVITNGEKKDLNKAQFEFDKIIANLRQVYKQGQIMPAFGVSLHNETINEMKFGCWLEIVYNKTQNKNGYLFDSLAIKLEDCFGFNIFRKYKGKYEGRCFYLSLDKETHLEDIIT